MPQVYTKENLMALGVYELRSLAREVGVKAPTMLTKEEIANAVISVLRGEEKPQRTNFGRPVKTGGKFVEALQLLKGQDFPKEIINNPKDILNNFSSVLSNDMIIPTFAEISFRGYVKLLQENTALVMAKGYCVDDFVHNVVITKETFSDFPLKDGDLVECLAASTGEGKPKIVTKIMSINGLHVKEFSKDREDFDNLLSLYPSKKFNLAKSFEECTNFKAHDKLLPIGIGSRTLITFPTSAKRAMLSYEYANAIHTNNFAKSLIIAIGESPEDKQEFINELKEQDIIFDDLAEENLLELLDVKINHVLRQVELGNDRVIIITNYSKFKNFLKDALKLYSLSDQEANSIINKRLLKLMNLAKNSEDYGSLTIIAMAEENSINLQEDMSLSTINTYIRHKNNYIANTLISLDFGKSYINRKEKLYTTGEFVKCEKFLIETKEIDFAERFKQFVK